MESTKSRYSDFLNLEHILAKYDQSTRKTKIVCTLGPACDDVDKLTQMLENGMSVARLNFSHGSHEMHGEFVRKVREANKRKPEKACAILLDTKGPEIRTGLLEGHKPVDLEMDQELFISTDYNLEGNNQMITCSYPTLPTSVKPGSIILMADGTISCEVLECRDDGVKVRCRNSCKLGEKKNMNLPGIIVDLPTVTPKDEDDLENFALLYNVDFIAASFVRKAQDVENIRDILGPRGAHIKIISKIENQEGLENFDEILRATDGIMVARGDLGMEIPPEKVFLAQKMMVQKCKAFGKPVITATQMMESMINNPRPTRAECTDVANAVIDGTDGVMLSGETASGKYPLDAVDIMARVCVEAERCIDYIIEYDKIRLSTPYTMGTSEGICSAAVRAALDLDVKLIIVITDTGVTAGQVAKYRPPMPILAVSMSQSTINQMNVHRGVLTLKVPSYEGIDNLLRYAIDMSKERNLVKSSDQVIAIHGMSESDINQANIMKILEVDQAF